MPKKRKTAQVQPRSPSGQKGGERLGSLDANEVQKPAPERLIDSATTAWIATLSAKQRKLLRGFASVGPVAFEDHNDHDDNGHTDDTYQDNPHNDNPHSDNAHQDDHSDNPHLDDQSHGDNIRHSDNSHSDAPHNDEHWDNEHGDHGHDDVHGDRFGDMHGDDHSDGGSHNDWDWERHFDHTDQNPWRVEPGRDVLMARMDALISQLEVRLLARFDEFARALKGPPSRPKP